MVTNHTGDRWSSLLTLTWSVTFVNTVLHIFAGDIALEVAGLSGGGGPFDTVHALEAVLIVGALLASSDAWLALELGVLEVTTRARAFGGVGFQSTGLTVSGKVVALIALLADGFIFFALFAVTDCASLALVF